MIKYDYENDLAIDPNNLDEECLIQPVLYMRYSEELAMSQKSRDKIKEKWEVTRAQTMLAIRKDPNEYNLSDKPTVDAVNAALTLDVNLEEIAHELNNANYELQILQSAIKAFDQRKKALEQLVSLFVSNYFAGPKQPRDLEGGKRLIDMARDQINADLNERIKEEENNVDNKEEKAGSSSRKKRSRLN